MDNKNIMNSTDSLSLSTCSSILDPTNKTSRSQISTPDKNEHSNPFGSVPSVLCINREPIFDKIVHSDSSSNSSSSSRQSSTSSSSSSKNPRKRQRTMKNTKENKYSVYDMKRKKRKAEKNWSKKAEKIMYAWKQKTQAYAWMHGYAARVYNILNIIINLPVLILTTLMSTTSVAALALYASNPPLWMNIMIMSVTVLVALLSAIQTFCDFAGKRTNHASTKQGFNLLSRKIQNELVKKRSARNECYGFFEMIGNDYDQLLEFDTGLPSLLMRRFRPSLEKTLIGWSEREDDFFGPSLINSSDETILPLYEQDKKLEKSRHTTDSSSSSTSENIRSQISNMSVTNPIRTPTNKKEHLQEVIKNYKHQSTIMQKEDSFSYMEAIRTIQKRESL
jgi:hypothetical protein